MQSQPGPVYLVSRQGAEPLAFARLVGDEESQEVIAAWCRDALEAQGGMFVADGTMGVTEVVAGLENFTVSDDGVVFYFPPFAVGPYAQGGFEVLLQFDRLLSQLKGRPNARFLENAAGRASTVEVILELDARDASPAR